MNRVSLISRLRSLEDRRHQTGEPAILMLPDNGRGEEPSVIRRKWDHFKRTGRLENGSRNGVVIIPRDAHEFGAGQQRVVEFLETIFDPQWYNNNAHELVGGSKEAVLADWMGYNENRECVVVSNLPWYSNEPNAYPLADGTERPAREVRARAPEPPADDSGIEHPPKSADNSEGARADAANPGAAA